MIRITLVAMTHPVTRMNVDQCGHDRAGRFCGPPRWSLALLMLLKRLVSGRSGVIPRSGSGSRLGFGAGAPVSAVLVPGSWPRVPCPGPWVGALGSSRVHSTLRIRKADPPEASDRGHQQYGRRKKPPPAQRAHGDREYPQHRCERRDHTAEGSADLDSRQDVVVPRTVRVIRNAEPTRNTATKSTKISMSALRTTGIRRVFVRRVGSDVTLNPYS
ncbi:hypothetical protein SAMN04487820_108219 [Actinopolyspora mzabensis]|uniref:Uncharacterized protein n=1 Tax=Actinopolyspora mzabensis TaxID=995066 RepID=A0A1G9CAV3_ACTMZ|nr:hypothetical protein SAMN04487820_108219 [Actinopolyspora mzabensis]